MRAAEDKFAVCAIASLVCESCNSIDERKYIRSSVMCFSQVSSLLTKCPLDLMAYRTCFPVDFNVVEQGQRSSLENS